MNKLKTSKGLFLFNGIVNIIVGLLHTFAHYNELVSPTIHNLLNKETTVMGTTSNIWDLWQGMSLMMGLLLIVIGSISIAIVRNLKDNEYPPKNISIIIILMLCAVIYCGANYFGPPQVYGGAFGIIVQSLSIILSNKQD